MRANQGTRHSKIKQRHEDNIGNDGSDKKDEDENGYDDCENDDGDGAAAAAGGGGGGGGDGDGGGDKDLMV